MQCVKALICTSSFFPPILAGSGKQPGPASAYGKAGPLGRISWRASGQVLQRSSPARPLFIRGKAGGERCYFFPLGLAEIQAWLERGKLMGPWAWGAACNVKELPEGGEEGAFSRRLPSVALQAIEKQIIRYRALCWTQLSTMTS